MKKPYLRYKGKNKAASDIEAGDYITLTGNASDVGRVEKVTQEDQALKIYITLIDALNTICEKFTAGHRFRVYETYPHKG